MQVIRTELDGVLILEPKVFGDSRGYFFESWNAEKYAAQGISCDWVQDNESCSRYGVIRGLHYQRGEFAQAKLVRVVQGAVLDVVVDIRKDSATFGQHVAVELTGENKRQLFIPRGFAHGFAVLSQTAIFAYKCDNAYAPHADAGIAYDDPSLKIDWKIPTQDRILSDKDLKHPRLEEI